MDHLPIFIKLKSKPVILVGDGEEAVSKARLLIRAGALISLVSPFHNEDLRHLVTESGGQHIANEYHAALLTNHQLVLAVSTSAQLNERIQLDANERNLAIYVANNPALSSFIFPEVIDRSPLTVAISAGETTSVLGKLLRAKLEAHIPQSYGRLAQLVEQCHAKVQGFFKGPQEEERFWLTHLQGQVAEKALNGEDETAAALIHQALTSTEPAKKGEVYLVGGGPGDPELLTFKALRLMQQADVVLYDQLVSAEVLALCHKKIEKIYVGKRSGNHAMAQEEINQLMVTLALQGKQVLRLKGGDPFVFGRGGEELQTLKQQGIPYQVVPGITAASACSTYAGIPLTHRNYAQSVKLVTGQLKNRSSDLDFKELLSPNQTVVFYMGLQNLAFLFKQLVTHGKPEQTPAAIVSKGATKDQQVLVGTLENLAEKQKQAQLPAPALIIVGEVVSLHEDLAWFGENMMNQHHFMLATPDMETEISHHLSY